MTFRCSPRTIFAPRYHLVLVTEADLAERVRRAVTDRGMTREQVLARVAAQASDAERRVVADVVLDTARTLGELEVAVARLWDERLRPYQSNVLAGRCAPRPAPVVRAGPVGGRGPDDGWRQRAARVLGRVRYVLGDAVVRAEHVGPTARPGASAVDVLDLGVVVTGSGEDAAAALAEAGLPRVPGYADRFANADPGLAVDLTLMAG